MATATATNLSSQLDRIELSIDQMIESQTQTCLQGIEDTLNGVRPELLGVNIWLGPSGIGKTSSIKYGVIKRVMTEGRDMVERLAEMLGCEAEYQYWERILAQHTGVDFGGIPWVVEGEDGPTMIRARPAHLPMEGMGLLLLDEGTKVQDPDMMNVMGQLIHMKRLNEHRMSPGFMIAMTGNLMSERTGDRELHPHIWKRLNIQYVRADRKVFMRHARANGMSAFMLAFLEMYPDYFMKDFPGQRKNANPRALEMASHIIEGGRFHGISLKSKLIGEIGEAAGAQLYAFHDLRDRIISPVEALAHPERVPFSTMDREAAFVVMAGVSQLVTRKELRSFNTLMERLETEQLDRAFGDTGGRELSGFALQNAIGRDETLLLCAEGAKLASRYPDICGIN